MASFSAALEQGQLLLETAWGKTASLSFVVASNYEEVEILLQDRGATNPNVAEANYYTVQEFPFPFHGVQAPPAVDSANLNSTHLE